MNIPRFGYPETCNTCETLGDSGRSLKVKPFYKPGGSFRLVIVGQDPTIRRSPERVTHVLMLDQPQGQLSRWLRGLLGSAFDHATIYATNVVKCSFSRPPSEMEPSGLSFLRPYARNCRTYLAQEVAAFQPSLLLTLGEPSHILFREALDDPDIVPDRMQEAFTGTFRQVSIEGVRFNYSPCLHIQTFRVAETYGPLVAQFKAGLREALAES